MSDTGNDEQMDVGSVVEAVSADHSFGAPLYVVESIPANSATMASTASRILPILSSQTVSSPAHSSVESQPPITTPVFPPSSTESK
ncbi:hypothetical protein F2Q70_00039034 [Brassica cretica]|uniref:Uncharacterized protein n=1 Tax=Brassica cretica TaxID=69181 RepID=A0A8S9KAA8_BRACR|nr:hypothetical protein F2Q70_00039034 [Brassica cretica]